MGETANEAQTAENGPPPDECRGGGGKGVVAEANSRFWRAACRYVICEKGVWSDGRSGGGPRIGTG